MVNLLRSSSTAFKKRFLEKDKLALRELRAQGALLARGMLQQCGYSVLLNVLS